MPNQALKAMENYELILEYGDLYRKVPKDMFGCDWPTLRLSYPDIYKTLKSVWDEIKNRGIEDRV